MKRLFYLLALLWFPSHAWAAIALDDTPSGTGSDAAPTSIVLAHTTGPTAGDVLIVACSALPASGTETITVSGYGTNFTQYDSKTQIMGSGLPYTAAIFFMVNPPTSTVGNITMTYNISGSPAIVAQSYSGVDQSTPIGGDQFVWNSTGSLTSNLTTTRLNSWLLSAMNIYTNGTGTLTFDGQLTARGTSGHLNLLRTADMAATSISAHSVTNTSNGLYNAALQFYVELLAATPSATPTPTWTPTATPTFTNSPVASPTASPSATRTATPTCSNQGTTSPAGYSQGGNGLLFFKQITLSTSTTIQTVAAYVASGYGPMQAALYSSYRGQPFQLIKQGTTIYVFPGWNTVPLGSPYEPAGTYWLGVETTNSAQIQYSIVGNDLFSYQSFGIWPNPANTQSYT